MSGQPCPPPLRTRSLYGCWTCRLRKKKCDEVHPACNRCSSVGIACRYGEKPIWIENRELAKEELEKIKAIVKKATLRRRSTYQANLRKLSTSEPASASSSSTLASLEKQDTVVQSSGGHDVRSSLQGNHGEHQHDSVVEKPYLCSNWGDDYEANLMMHYLDEVFYIQWRFYTPSLATGGRGWLLSLLTHTKPLYHAALSLSAFHQQSLLCSGQDAGKTQISTLNELEGHYNTTLQELQLFIHACNENGSAEETFAKNMQILACTVELISFELFNGGVSNWQMHLRAASSLVLMAHGISESRTAELPDLYRVDSSSPSASFAARCEAILSNNPALHFFSGVIISQDILACISTGSRPYLWQFHRQLLCVHGRSGYHKDDHDDRRIKLHTIMGCENWALVGICEIACLSTWKVDQQEAGTLNGQELLDRAAQIHRYIEGNSTAVAKDLEKLRQQYPLGPPPRSSRDAYERYLVYIITSIYASAAQIHLSNILSPVSPFHPVQETMEMAMSGFRALPDPIMTRCLIWPLCVAGCMASSSEDQAFFRELCELAINDAKTFGNSQQALEVLEMSWAMRARGEIEVDCTSVVRQLGTCVLLV